MLVFCMLAQVYCSATSTALQWQQLVLLERGVVFFVSEIKPFNNAQVAVHVSSKTNQESISCYKDEQHQVLWNLEVVPLWRQDENGTSLGISFREATTVISIKDRQGGEIPARHRLPSVLGLLYSHRNGKRLNAAPLLKQLPPPILLFCCLSLFIAPAPNTFPSSCLVSFVPFLYPSTSAYPYNSPVM